MRKMSAKNGAYNLSVHTKRHTHTKHAHTQQVFLGLAVVCFACWPQGAWRWAAVRAAS